MADRPGLFVDWDLNETDVADPTNAEVNDGYVINQRPTRQVMNRLKNLYGRWVRWFDQATRRIGHDLLEDGELYRHTVLPAEFTGDPPAWGGTHSTTIPDAWFVGAAVINGDRIGPIDAPATTLPDSSDVYVDLGDDGEWDFNAVGNGAGAPALAADHVRFFMFETNALSEIVDGTYFRIGFRYSGLGSLVRATAGLMLSASRGLTFDAVSNRSVIIHDGIVEGGNGDIGAITPETLAAKELLAGRSATVPAGLASNDSHWWGITINARWTGTEWDRRVATDDSYLFVLHKGGLAILHHPAAQAAPWANTLDPATWTVVGQFGAGGSGEGGGNLQVGADGSVSILGTLTGSQAQFSGAAVALNVRGTQYVEVTSDAPATMPADRRLYADTMIRAWGLVATDGVGGITTQNGVGYTASVVGGNVRITFDQPFQSNAHYAVSASCASSASNHFVTMTGVAADRVDLHLTEDDGTDVDLAAEQHSIMFMIVGRLA